MFEYGDTAMEDNAEEGGDQERASDEPDDDLGRVIADAREDCAGASARFRDVSWVSSLAGT